VRKVLELTTNIGTTRTLQTMESNIEVEPYKETIGNLNSNIPVVSRPSSSDQVTSVHPFQEPIYRTELEDFSCSTANLWPDPLMSHARQTQVPQKLGSRNTSIPVGVALVCKQVVNYSKL